MKNHKQAHLLDGFRAKTKSNRKPGDAFANRMDVLRYLQTLGFKIPQAKLYLDYRKGLLKVELDGTVLASSVQEYIKHPLSRLLSPVHDAHEEMVALQRAKLAADTKRALAQAEHWETRARATRGVYVESFLCEQNLAARMALFRADLEIFARTSAGDIIRLVGGDLAKAPDLIDMLLDKVRQWLARYAEDREFVVPSIRVRGGDNGSDDNGAD